MSMHLHVYVGPYIRAELPEGLSPDGALGGWEGLIGRQPNESSRIYFYVPEEGFWQVDHTITYEPHGDNDPFEVDAETIEAETERFRFVFRQAYDMLKASATHAAIGWGVVPYWY